MKKTFFHPWGYLLDELKARKITQTKFADIIDIPVSALNEIIKWKKNLTPDLCVRIEEALGISARTRMNLQVAYSLWIAKQKESKRIQRVREKLKEYHIENDNLTEEEIEDIIFWNKKTEEEKQDSKVRILEPVYA